MRTLTVRGIVRNGSVTPDNLPADAECADAVVVITHDREVEGVGFLNPFVEASPS